jgi:hypothetical protein
MVRSPEAIKRLIRDLLKNKILTSCIALTISPISL